MIAQNGMFQVRQRQGEAVTDVVRRATNAAVRQPGADGKSSNALEVRVNGDTVELRNQRHGRALGPEGRR